jgi:histidinol-phosphatase (PHP family)
MISRQTIPWKVSLHGGHSGAFCDHAEGKLEDIILEAIAQGFPVYGVTEHAPRVEAEHLYQEEIDMGWDVATLDQHFEEYARTVTALAEKYADRITVLRGFEIEVVPEDRYVEVMQGYRDRYQFDYIVGSVHWVRHFIMDYGEEYYQQAIKYFGGVEELAVQYYKAVGTMVENMNPEVVGHLDVIKRNAPAGAVMDSPPIRKAALAALEIIRDREAILDLNTAGYRKKLGGPYPAPWLVEAARDMGIPFCFGDDSHRPSEVGADFDKARDYLMEHGVRTITILCKDESGLGRRCVPLD